MPHRTVKSGTILVVDDDQAFRESIVEVLKNHNMTVLEASTGEEALQNFDPNVVDAILSDVKMPKMSGIDLLSTLRQRDCEVPFVMITGYGEPRLIIAALRLGATDYLEKPFNLDDLARTAINAVGYGKALKEIANDLKLLTSQRQVSFDELMKFKKRRSAIAKMRWSNTGWTKKAG